MVAGNADLGLKKWVFAGHPKLITPFLILTDFEPRNYVNICVCVCVYIYIYKIY